MPWALVHASLRPACALGPGAPDWDARRRDDTGGGKGGVSTSTCCEVGLWSDAAALAGGEPCPVWAGPGARAPERCTQWHRYHDIVALISWHHDHGI